MSTRSEEDLLDLEILDAVAGLFVRIVGEGEALSSVFGIPPFVIKALHMLDTPLAMKDLGRRMHCDPSFVTSIADTLEQRGLAVREGDPGDRRVKRLVLTPAGADLKARVEDAMLARIPWRTALTLDERAGLLALMRKMIPQSTAAESAGCPAGGVSDFLATAAAPLPGAQAPDRGRDPATAGSTA